MAMKKSEKTWFDGELVPWDQATVHVSAHALHYGSSVFEGIRAYPFSEGPAIFCLEEHLDRLWASCKVYRMEIPYSRAEVRQAILDTIRALDGRREEDPHRGESKAYKGRRAGVLDQADQ